MRSDRFVLFDFVRTMIGCRYVAPGEGREVYKSAYPFAPNYGGLAETPDASVTTTG